MQRPSPETGRPSHRPIWRRLAAAAAVSLMLSVVTATAAAAATLSTTALLESDSLGGTITNTITMSGEPSGTGIALYLSVNGGPSTYQNTQTTASETVTATADVQQVNVYVAKAVDPSTGSDLGPQTTFTFAWISAYSGVGAVFLNASQASGSTLTEGTPTKIKAQYNAGTVPANSQLWILASPQPPGAVPASGATIPITANDILDECPLSNYTTCRATYTPSPGPQTVFFEAYIIQYQDGVAAFIAACSSPVVINWTNPSSVSLAISPTASQSTGSAFTLTATISPPGYSYDVYICDLTTTAGTGSSTPGGVTAVPNATQASGTISESTAQTDTFVAYITNTNNNSVCTGSANGVTEASNSVTATWSAPTVTLAANPTALATGSATALTAAMLNEPPGANVSICDSPTATQGQDTGCVPGSTEPVTEYTAGTYYFQALMGDSGNIVAASAIVAVTWSAGPIVTLAANPVTLATGSATALTAATANEPSGANVAICDSPTATQGQDTACVSGNTESVTEYTAGTYYFQALMGDSGNIVAASAIVAVTWQSSAPPASNSSYLCAMNSSLVRANGSACLAWDTIPGGGVSSGVSETVDGSASQPVLDIAYGDADGYTGSSTAYGVLYVVSSSYPVVFPNGPACDAGVVTPTGANSCTVVAQSAEPQTVVFGATFEGMTVPETVSITYLYVPPAAANISCGGQAPGTNCIVPYGTVVPICTQFSIPASPDNPSPAPNCTDVKS